MFSVKLHNSRRSQKLILTVSKILQDCIPQPQNNIIIVINYKITVKAIIQNTSNPCTFHELMSTFDKAIRHFIVLLVGFVSINSLHLESLAYCPRYTDLTLPNIQVHINRPPAHPNSIIEQDPGQRGLAHIARPNYHGNWASGVFLFRCHPLLL